MESIVSYPVRGDYGHNTYRGNCSGLLIKDLIKQYRLQGLSDFMVGSGTTEDVVREAGIRGDFTDLNRGYDMLSMDIPYRAENCFWHPPYHNMVIYSDSQYSVKNVEAVTGLSAETILADDLSRCANWEEFVQKMNYCMMKQFAALEKGGRMFVLVGDLKRSGRFFSMIRELICPGTMENIIIKAQHNTWSERQTYTGNFVPIVHEYLLVTRKDAPLVMPVSWGVRRQDYDLRESNAPSWRDLVWATIEHHGGRMTLQELYDTLKDSAKAKGNGHWQEKIRQTVQDLRSFRRTERGCYALATAA